MEEEEEEDEAEKKVSTCTDLVLKQYHALPRLKQLYLNLTRRVADTRGEIDAGSMRQSAPSGE